MDVFPPCTLPTEGLLYSSQASVYPPHFSLLCPPSPWSHGRHLVLDFTCPDTLAPSHLRSTAAETGSAAKEAEERKVSKYRSIADYHAFIPVAVETLGPMGPEAKSLLLDLGRRLRQHTGEPRSTSYLIQQISMAIQKGNAVAMMGSLPHGKELDELLQL